MTLDDMVLKLAVLHVFNQGQIELRDKVLIHVEQYISDHDNALLDLLPNAIELSEKLFIMGLSQIICDWFE